MLETVIMLLTGANAAYELGHNVARARERKRTRIGERAGRIKIRIAARKLERLGGRRAKVRWGLGDDTDRDPVLVVEQWPSGKLTPDVFLGYPVIKP